MKKINLSIVRKKIIQIKRILVEFSWLNKPRSSKYCWLCKRCLWNGYLQSMIYIFNLLTIGFILSSSHTFTSTSSYCHFKTKESFGPSAYASEILPKKTWNINKNDFKQVMWSSYKLNGAEIGRTWKNYKNISLFQYTIARSIRKIYLIW